MALRKLIPWRWGAKHVPIRRGDEHPLASLQREMNRVFEEFFRGFGSSGFWEAEALAGGYTPLVDVTEDDSDIVVTAELPGLDEHDFEVALDHDTLTIRGEKHEEKEDRGKDFYRVERSYGSFQRVIPLPCEVEEDKAEATFRKGVLKVRLPKTAEARKAVKRIPVKAA